MRDLSQSLSSSQNFACGAYVGFLPSSIHPETSNRCFSFGCNTALYRALHPLQLECQRGTRTPELTPCQGSPSQARLGTGRDARPRLFALTTQHKSILAFSDERILEYYHVIIIIATLQQMRRRVRSDERESVLGECSRLGRQGDIATRWTIEELCDDMSVLKTATGQCIYLDGGALRRSHFSLKRHRPA